MIDTVRYTNPEGTAIIVEPEGWNMPQPCRSWHQEVVDEWLLVEGNEIQPYVEPLESVIDRKVAELTGAFQAEANADVLSGGQVWRGGADSASLFKHAADKASHKVRLNGVIHSKDHVPHTLTPNQIKDIAADIGDAYETAYAKYQSKLLELKTCGGNTACINNITWAV